VARNGGAGDPAPVVGIPAVVRDARADSETRVGGAPGDDNVGAPKEKLNLFKLMIPAVFDMAETSLKNVTLSMISTSVT
jgi:hypothetical protein